MSLADLVSAAAHRDLPPRAVAVTFDDGYLDMLTNALPALIENSVPTTVFITTGNPGRPFWWDRLSQQIMGPAVRPTTPLQIQGGDKSIRWAVDGVDAIRLDQVLCEVHEWCCQLSVETRETVVRQVEAWSAQTMENGVRALTLDELKKLAAANGVSIGAHTVNHPVLSLLPPETQLQELRQSRTFLETLIGSPITTMSYPFGLEGAHYNHVTVQMAQLAGYTAACNAHSGTVGRGTNAWQLPRYWVNDWSADELIRRLTWWLG
jgi:peptidoglycan/xylan/chitin deacetylase (PgdA/CDA1 family)